MKNIKAGELREAIANLPYKADIVVYDNYANEYRELDLSNLIGGVCRLDLTDKIEGYERRMKDKPFPKSKLEIIRLHDMLLKSNIECTLTKSESFIVITDGFDIGSANSHTLTCFERNSDERRIVTILQTEDSVGSERNLLQISYGDFGEVNGLTATEVFDRLSYFYSDGAMLNFERLGLKPDEQFSYNSRRYLINEYGIVSDCNQGSRTFVAISDDAMSDMIDNRDQIKSINWIPLSSFSAGDPFYYLGVDGFIGRKTYCNDVFDSYLVGDNNYYQSKELANKKSEKKSETYIEISKKENKSEDFGTCMNKSYNSTCPTQLKDHNEPYLMIDFILSDSAYHRSIEKFSVSEFVETCKKQGKIIQVIRQEDLLPSMINVYELRRIIKNDKGCCFIDSRGLERIIDAYLTNNLVFFDSCGHESLDNKTMQVVRFEGLLESMANLDDLRKIIKNDKDYCLIDSSMLKRIISAYINNLDLPF